MVTEHEGTEKVFVTDEEEEEWSGMWMADDCGRKRFEGCMGVKGSEGKGVRVYIETATVGHASLPCTRQHVAEGKESKVCDTAHSQLGTGMCRVHATVR